MNKKILGILVIGMAVLVVGCVTSPEDTPQSYDYRLDSLMIGFNGERQDALSAVSFFENGTDNVLFKEYFVQELNSLAKPIRKVTELKISDWFSLSNGAAIKIIYSSEISDKEKSKLLEEIKSQLEQKGYVDHVHYSHIGKFIE